ncbi:hypothetical protein ACFL3X_01620 [Gemmatimonadota bacterium]
MPKKESKARPLLVGHLERISSKVFSDYPKQVTDLVGQKHGVYALYKGPKLYYVGLASNLRNRVKHHLRDKHAGKWDKFSLYLVRRTAHVKEIESLVIRIADPTGNTSSGHLPHVDDLKNELLAGVQDAQQKKLKVIFGEKVTRKRGPQQKTGDKRAQPSKRNTISSHIPPLAQYISEGFEIRASNKGNMYTARVHKNGQICYEGELYNAPSFAGRLLLGRSVNGWTFWKYKNSEGNWVKLDELRK